MEREGTEGNVTVRAVGLAVKRIGKEDEMNTAALCLQGLSGNRWVLKNF